MARTNFTTLVSAFPLAGGSTNTFEIDVSGFQECQLYLAVTYPTTSSTTGLAASAADGCGPFSSVAPPVVINTPSTGRFYDSVASATTLPLNPVAPLAGTPQTVVTKINLVMNQIGGWYRLTIKNNDASVGAVLNIYADCG